MDVINLRSRGGRVCVRGGGRGGRVRGRGRPRTALSAETLASMMYRVLVHENTEGRGTKSAAQLEQILCGPINSHSEKRMYFFIFFYDYINTKGSSGNKYCILLCGYFPF